MYYIKYYILLIRKHFEKYYINYLKIFGLENVICLRDIFKLLLSNNSPFVQMIKPSFKKVIESQIFKKKIIWLDGDNF